MKTNDILKNVGTTLLAGAVALTIAGSAYAGSHNARINKAKAIAEQQEKQRNEDFKKEIKIFYEGYLRRVGKGDIGNSLENLIALKKKYNADTNPLYLKTKEEVVWSAKKLSEMRQSFMQSNGEVGDDYYPLCKKLAGMFSEHETKPAKVEAVVAKVIEKKKEPKQEVKVVMAENIFVSPKLYRHQPKLILSNFEKEIVMPQVQTPRIINAVFEKPVEIIPRIPEKKLIPYEEATLKSLEKALPYFKTAAEKTGLPEKLFDEYVGLGWTESWFEAGAKGDAGERGYHQMMKSTYLLYYNDKKTRETYSLLPWSYVDKFPKAPESIQSLEIASALHFCSRVNSSRLKKIKKYLDDPREIILRYNWGDSGVDSAIVKNGNFDNLWNHLKKKENDRDKKAYYYVVYTLRYRDKAMERVRDIEKNLGQVVTYNKEL